ncbi:unnamed protein product, partial [Didymodactylos carnosus]
APNLKKLHNHNGDENRCKAEEFKMAIKRRIEHSPQPVKRVYKQELTSLYTTSPQIAPSIPMFHEIKNSLEIYGSMSWMNFKILNVLINL